MAQFPGFTSYENGLHLGAGWWELLDSLGINLHLAIDAVLNRVLKCDATKIKVLKLWDLLIYSEST